MSGAKDTEWIETQLLKTKQAHEYNQPSVASTMAEERTAWAWGHEDTTQKKKSLFFMMRKPWQRGDPDTGIQNYKAPLSIPLLSACTHWAAFGPGPSL